MASVPGRRGNGGGVTRGEGKGQPRCCLGKGHGSPPASSTPADMSPKLRASLINRALPLHSLRSLSLSPMFSASPFLSFSQFVIFPPLLCIILLPVSSLFVGSLIVF